MNIILIAQPEAYRQVESGIRCPVCGDRMEAINHHGKWFLECVSCVTVFGGFSGTASGGFFSECLVGSEMCIRDRPRVDF